LRPPDARIKSTITGRLDWNGLRDTFGQTYTLKDLDNLFSPWAQRCRGGCRRAKGMTMRTQPQGNGSGKFNVHQLDMGGWVRVFTDRLDAVPEDFGYYLSQTVAEWFRQRPQLAVRFIVPIVRDGRTVELHAWYCVQTFPALHGPEPSPPGG
jgi:hypothetical protein